MSKLTIIDAYDYNVDFIENIVEKMNNSLSKFGKYSVSNGEVSRIIILNMCEEIQSYDGNTLENILDHLLAPKKNTSGKRKLAIEIDDELIALTNKTISIILQAGYKKIPSRTMFFRESLRVFYNNFDESVASVEIRTEGAILGLYDLYAKKLLGSNTYNNKADHPLGLGDDISTFIAQGLLGPDFWQSIVDNYEIINRILKDGEPNLTDIKENTERIFKFIDKVIEEDESNPEILKFIEIGNDIPIEIQKSQLQNLIEIIEPEYATINNKIKLYFLFSFIEKEFRKIELMIRFYFAPESRYTKKNAMEFTELYLIAAGLTLADKGYLIQLPEQKRKIQKLLIDIANYNIQQNMLVGSYFKHFPYGKYVKVTHSSVVLFLSNVFLAITSNGLINVYEGIEEVYGSGERFTIEHLVYWIRENLPKFIFKE